MLMKRNYDSSDQKYLPLWCLTDSFSRVFHNFRLIRRIQRRRTTIQQLDKFNKKDIFKKIRLEQELNRDRLLSC